MSFSGDLTGIGLADVIQNVHGNRLTGMLKVSSAVGDRFIYFSGGLVAGYSLGVNRGLPIADHLVQRQYVTEADLQRAKKRKSRQRCSLREAMAGLRLLEESTFYAAVAELVQEHVYELLSLRDAQFEFSEGKPPPRIFDAEQKGARVAIDPAGILMEGARREDEISRIHQVVTTDRDIFVMAEGWEEYEISDVQMEVGGLLDGSTDVKSILDTVPHSRFDVLKAINDLVRFDLARPLSGREMETMAQDAIAAGNDEDAMALLNRALVTERSNGELRSRLVGLLEKSGRLEEAATELAVLGYQEVQRGNQAEALEFYENAVRLKPDDIGMLEKRLELLEAIECEDFVPALCDYSKQLSSAGLAAKAKAKIEAAMPRFAGDQLLSLQTALIDLEEQLGNFPAAAEIYRAMIERLPKNDEAGHLELLRKALALVPEDEAIAAELHDIESGRREERRRRRRRSLALVASLLVITGIGALGVFEMIASHRIIATLHGRLDEVSGGQPAAALDELERVQREYPFTLAARRAGVLATQLFDLQVTHLRDLLDEGKTRRAGEVLTGLRAQIKDEVRRDRLAILQGRVDAELRASELYTAINRVVPDAEACAEFKKLTDETLLDFHLARLSHPEHVYPLAQAVLLEVLADIDSPRSIAVVAKVYVASEDPIVRREAMRVLQRADVHRDAGHAASWESVYPELEQVAADPRKRPRVARVTRWLRGAAAVQNRAVDAIDAAGATATGAPKPLQPAR